MASLDERNEALRIVSLNLGSDGDKHGAWADRAARAARAIRADAADLVVLQAAVAYDDGSGALPTLAAALPEYRYQAFAGAQREGIATGGSFGSAVLSRVPLVAVRSIPLACMGGEDDNARVLLHVTVERDGGPLHMLNAHFSWVAEQAGANLHEALRYADGVAGNMLLVGDLNQTPDSDFARAFAAAGWTDGWAARGHGDGFTFEAGKPWGRIDQLWLRGGLAGALVDMDVIAAAPDAALSDHLALRFSLRSAMVAPGSLAERATIGRT